MLQELILETVSLIKPANNICERLDSADEMDVIYAGVVLTTTELPRFG